jgi:hypothetical protein
VREALVRKKKWLLAALLVVVTSTATAVALASAGWGVTTTTYVTAHFDKTVHVNSDRVKFQTKDPTLVRVQKLEWLPGAYSGWHHHPGVIIVTVQSGSVTVMDAACNTVTYGPGLPDGAAFVEGGDAPMQVTSANGAVEYAMQIAPRTDPPVFRIEDDPPPCAQ